MSGQEAEVQVLPPCNFHAAIKAAYDGKTSFGPWAYMCPNCFVNYGLGLGVGRGQRLVLAAKKGKS